MTRKVKDPKAIFPSIVDGFKRVFGNDLVSVIVYGSAVGGEYVPGASDINFIVVLTEQMINSIDLALGIVTKWKKQNVATPLFLTENYVQTSLDVFPIEYLNFHNNYEIIYGRDIFEGLTFDHHYVRLQCEREIKGKLLLLREAFFETGGKAKNLGGLIGDSLGAFIAIFNGLLYLREQPLPKHKRDIVLKTCDIFHLDRVLFEKLLDVKAQKIRPSDSEMKTLFRAYLKQIRLLWISVNELASNGP